MMETRTIRTRGRKVHSCHAHPNAQPPILLPVVRSPHRTHHQARSYVSISVGGRRDFILRGFMHWPSSYRARSNHDACDKATSGPSSTSLDHTQSRWTAPYSSPSFYSSFFLHGAHAVFSHPSFYHPPPQCTLPRSPPIMGCMYSLASQVLL